MRWFVDVSRVGEDTKLVEKFVLEAKQWQAALQEARKRRGDTGPLSTFSIELLDNGYRAVDPSQQIRYAVHKAPADTPLSGEGAPGAFPAVAMQPKIAEQANNTDPMAAPPPSKSDPSASGPKTDPMAALPPESAPTTARMNDKPAASLPLSNTERMTTSSAVSETASTKPNPVAPENESRPISTSPPEAQRMPAPIVRPPRPEIPDESATSAPFTQTKPAVSPPTSHKTVESVEVAQAPDFLVVKKREEEPNDKVPIRYREYAYAVKPGTDRKAVEVLLWLRFREVQESLKASTGRRFVQLAVFDHVFSSKPARPPIATLAWKDWRGDPVVQIMDAPRPASIPPPAVSQVPRPESTAPPRAEPPGPSAAPLTTPSRPEHSVPPAPAPSVAPSAPAATPNVTGTIPPASGPIIEITASESIPAPPESVPSPKPVEASVTAPTERVGASTDPAITQQSVIIAPEPKVDVPPPTQPAVETPRKKTKRRRASDDLIGELFEKMHELHFSPDMVGGVEFVLGVINATLPSEGIVVHVYDINTRQFVIVRALGPSPQSVVLHRTPDSDALFKKGMRATRCLRTPNAKSETAYTDGRFSLLGVAPTSALFGPVSLGGRYLGAVELLNPPGGEPFTENEANALDYICEQLAEFLASRPIVLDPDVVVGKS
jgi:hypothetical protein